MTLGVLGVFIALPLRGLYRATGSSMEEGFMLVFPRLMRDGWVPNVDFLHLYGPGSLHTLIGWYAVFGDTLESERTFGLLQHLGIIFGIYALTRVWGRAVALMSSLVATLLVLTPIGLSALAWHGAIALGLWAIVFGLRAARLDGRRATVSLAASAVLAGLAISYRPDLALGLGVSLGWWWWHTRRPGRWWVIAIAFAAGLIPMWIHLAMAGFRASVEGMLLDPVFRLRAGRELPRPPSWDRIDGALQAVAEGVPPWWGFPALPAEKQLFFWFWAVIAVAIAVPVYAYWTRRRSGPDLRLDVLLVGGLFGLGILPQAMQRPDSTHLAWVACVSWPLATAAVADLFQRARNEQPRLRRHVLTGLIAAGALFVVCPFYTYRHYVLHTRVAAGDLPLPFLVERDGRRFWFGDGRVAEAANAGIAELELRMEPGDRLLVGPADLSRTVYSDVAFYYLFPELEPATFYVEMDPGLADAENSGLAEDVASADYLFLTNFWTGWFEPNASSDYGSERPNEVVAEKFCLVGEWDNALVMLFERCPGGDGINPAEVGERPPPEGGARP